jgi:hypothetical protein
VLVALVLCALLVASARAQSPGVWGEVSAPLVRSDRWLWMGSTEVRTDETLPRPTFIGRGSTSVRFKLPRDWSLRAGFVARLRGQGMTTQGWQYNVNGGVSYPLPWTGEAGVGTTLLEHQFLPANLADRDRLRQRFEFNWDTGKVSPFAMEELFFQNGSGLVITRSRLGLAFTLPHSFELRTGYQFQEVKRSSGTWQPRHQILLQLRLPTFVDLRSKKKHQEPEQQIEDLEQ